MKNEMNNRLQFVNPEQAKKLEKAGFDWECEYGYNNAILLTASMIASAIGKNMIIRGNINKWYKYGFTSAPTVALALKWIREKKGLHGTVELNINFNWFTTGTVIDKKATFLNFEAKEYKTFDAAESALLDELLDELLKVVEDEKE